MLNRYARYLPLPTLARFFAFALVVIALLALPLACGGGGNGEAGDSDTPFSGVTDSPEDGDGEGDGLGSRVSSVRGGNLFDGIELVPDDLLKFLEGTNTNILFLDVEAAIDALKGHEDVRDELKEEWDDFDLSDEAGLEIQDVEYVAFGENGDPDDDVFLLRGVDFDNLRDEVKERAEDYWEWEAMGLEVLHAEYGLTYALIGDAVLVGGERQYDDYEVYDLLRNFVRKYGGAGEVLELAALEETEADDLLALLAGNEAATEVVLWDLAVIWKHDALFSQWMEADLFTRYAEQLSEAEVERLGRYGETELDGEDVLGYWLEMGQGLHSDFARWLVENEDAMKNFARWLSGDEEAMENYVRQLATSHGWGPGGGGWVMVNGVRVYVTDDDRKMGEMVRHLSDIETAVNIFNWWLEGVDEADEAMAGTWSKEAERTRMLMEQGTGVEVVSFYEEGGQLWDSVPNGIVKQGNWGSASYDRPPYRSRFETRAFVHSITQENDQQFRLMGIVEFESAAEATEISEGLEPDDIHEACEATFETEGKTIKVEALCGVEALVDLTSVS